jgi:2-dehydro-3-deoxygluconokinase
MQTPDPDVIALGETMLSLIAADAPLATSRTMHVSFGGAEANTCVGLVQLGVPAAWVSRLGTDAAGDRVLSLLEGAGVDVRWVGRDPQRRTGLMLRDTKGTVAYYRTGSAASVLGPADLDGVPVASARAVLVTGITALIGPEPRRAAIALLDAATGLRVVDPNLRRGLWGSDRAAELVSPLVARGDVLLGGERELALFAGDLHGERLARACRELGPREVVVKRGVRGAGVLDEHDEWHEHVPEPVVEVDPVGAGDAFNAGYVAARLAGAAAADALGQGAKRGAAVVTMLGDAIEVR